MKCKQCGYQFRMIDIPIEERIYDKYSAQFQCPNCKCWLQADKRFKFLSIFGLLLAATSSITGILNSMNITNIESTFLFLVAGIGITVVILSSISVKLEIVK
jgi:hypothetical protein